MHTSLRVVLFRMHLWKFSFCCIQLLQFLLLASVLRHLPQVYRLGATDLGSLIITGPTSSTFSGWLSVANWFKEMSNRWLTRELLEESKLYRLVSHQKVYILWGNSLYSQRWLLHWPLDVIFVGFVVKCLLLSFFTLFGSIQGLAYSRIYFVS